MVDMEAVTLVSAVPVLMTVNEYTLKCSNLIIKLNMRHNKEASTTIFSGTFTSQGFI